jgi:hypothetical protein
MYYDDHNPPHFHAIYNEYAAEIDIQSLKILHGDIPKKVLSLVTEWAKIHQNELKENWSKAIIGEKIHVIKPLI